MHRVLRNASATLFGQEDAESIDLQVGKTVHSGMPPSMRTELWMSVLLRKGQGAEAAGQYRKMLAKVCQCALTSLLANTCSVWKHAARCLSPERGSW